MSATFMEVLDTTIVNVALPHIAGNLSAGIDESTWVLTSYLVANAIVLPMTGWLARTFGRKRFLICCIILFTLASALCGMATSLPMLIAARILQGAGGGALQPISQAILLESFPPQKRGVAMSVFGMGVVVAPIIGPTLGGWMTDNYSWRWTFYVNLPVGILAVLLTYWFVEDPPYLRRAASEGRSKIDFFGFGLLAVWVASLQVVLDKGQQEDWFSSTFIRSLVGIAAVALVTFVWWELRVPEPIVNLRVLKNRNFYMGTILMTLMGVVLYGSISLLPLFLQTLLGYSAFQSGWTVSPRGFGSVVGMILVGRAMGFVEPRMLIATGLIILGYSTYALGSLNTQVAPMNITWPNIFNGFGTALVFVPLTTITMGTLKNEQMGNAAGIFNLMRNLGGGIGIALVTTMLSRRAQVHQAAMVGHLTPYDQPYSNFMSAITPGMGGGDPVAAVAQAHAMMYAELSRQASLWAFVDNFRLLAALSFICLPALLIFRRARPSKEAAALAH